MDVDVNIKKFEMEKTFQSNKIEKNEKEKRIGWNPN